jgi:phosphoribosylamine--glycine ligase
VFIGLINVNNEPLLLNITSEWGSGNRSGCSRFSRIVFCCQWKLDEITLEIDERSANGYVSGGYPEDYEKEKWFGLEKIDSIVFHAGTKLQNGLCRNGGRVLAITSYGNDFQEAIKNLIKI